MRVSCPVRCCASSVASNSRPQHFGRWHAGFTLVEMIVVITLLAVFMSVGIVLLGLLLRTDTAGHEAVAGQLTVARLSRQFRTDAHAALDVQPVPDAPGALALQLADDCRVVWSAAAGAVQRTVHREDGVASRETFHITDGTVELSIAPGGDLVGLSVRRPPGVPVETGAGQVAASSDALRIQAAVGIGLPSAPRAPASTALTQKEPR